MHFIVQHENNLENYVYYINSYFIMITLLFISFEWKKAYVLSFGIQVWQCVKAKTTEEGKKTRASERERERNGEKISLSIHSLK